MSWTEKTFEEKMTPFINDEYRKIFGEHLVEIYRNSRETCDDKRLMFMDMELAIDTHLKFKNGSILTLQEKTRRNYYIKYNDFTFEYYNDPNTKEIGEWFKLASQLYFYGFANKQENGYEKYYILDVAKLRTGLMGKFTINQLVDWYLKSNIPPAKANFFAIPFSTLKHIGGIVLLESATNNKVTMKTPEPTLK